MADPCIPCPAPDPKTPFTGVKIGESGSGVAPCPPTVPCPPTPPLSNLTEAPPETTWGGNDGQGGTGVPPTVPPTPPKPGPTPVLPSPVVFPSLLKGLNPDGTLEWYTDTTGFSVLLSGHASNADFSWQEMPEWFLQGFGIVNPFPPNDAVSLPNNSVLVKKNTGNALWYQFTPPDITKAYALGFGAGSTLDFFEVGTSGGATPAWVNAVTPIWSVPVMDGAGAKGWISPSQYPPNFDLTVSRFLTWDEAAVNFEWDIIPTFLLQVLNGTSTTYSFLTTDGTGTPIWDQATLSSTNLPGFPAGSSFLTTQAGALKWEELTWRNSSVLRTLDTGLLDWLTYKEGSLLLAQTTAGVQTVQWSQAGASAFYASNGAGLISPHAPANNAHDYFPTVKAGQRKSRNTS